MIIQRIVELLLQTPEIKALVDDRIYPVEWPAAPTYPLIIVQRAGGKGLTTMRGDAGIEEARVQVEVYTDRGYVALVSITTAVRRLLHGYKGGPRDAPCCIDRSALIGMMDLPANEVQQAGPRLRRRCLDFSVWSKEI